MNWEKFKIFGTTEKTPATEHVEDNFVINASSPEERIEAFMGRSIEDQERIIAKMKEEHFSEEILGNLQRAHQEKIEKEKMSKAS